MWAAPPCPFPQGRCLFAILVALPQLQKNHAAKLFRFTEGRENFVHRQASRPMRRHIEVLPHSLPTVRSGVLRAFSQDGYPLRRVRAPFSRWTAENEACFFLDGRKRRQRRRSSSRRGWQALHQQEAFLKIFESANYVFRDCGVIFLDCSNTISWRCSC